MTNSYSNTPFNDDSDPVVTSLQEQDLLFQDKDTLNNYKDEDGNPITPSYVKGSKIWFWDKNSEQWVLQHAVVLGDETIKQGPPGGIGKSAYQSYLDTTQDEFPLSEEDWIESLRGNDGLDGRDGIDGNDGIDGEDGLSGSGTQGPKGDKGDAVCDNVELAPESGERGKLFIDSVNQIIVTLG